MRARESIASGAAKILVVEDEAGARATLCAILEEAGYEVIGAGKGAEALELIRARPLNAVIMDIRLPDVDGMVILEQAREMEPDVAVIMMTGYASLETAVEAVNAGAYAYFVKPVNMDEMKTAIVNALRQQKLSRENKRLVDDLQQSNKLLRIEIAKRKRVEEEIRQINERLAIQNRKLEAQRAELIEKGREVARASQAKSAFLAGMSHELRTPLNIIIGFSQLLLDSVPGGINEAQKQCLGDILASGEHLLNLINDVLDLSKVEAGKIELKPERLNLADIIDDVVKTVKPMLDRDRHRLVVGMAEGLPQVWGDRGRLRQILLNLVGNAIKFTPLGGKLGIRVSRDGGWCAVSVVDNGIGIRQEDQERIFEPFTQVGFPPGKTKEGTGLGLALTRQFVEMSGGRIWVESEYGKGSGFTFTLPLAPTERGCKQGDG